MERISHGQLIFEPLYGFCAALGKEVSTQYDVISGVLVEDDSLLLADSSTFVKLWQADVSKYNHLVAEIGAIDCVNLFGFLYLEWLAFSRQYPFIDEGVRRSWIKKDFEDFLGANCSNCVSSQDADWR